MILPNHLLDTLGATLAAVTEFYEDMEQLAPHNEQRRADHVNRFVSWLDNELTRREIREIRDHIEREFRKQTRCLTCGDIAFHRHTPNTEVDRNLARSAVNDHNI